MDGGTIRRKLIHRASFRASVLHLSELNAVLKGIAPFRCLLTTPSLLSRPPAISRIEAFLLTLQIQPPARVPYLLTVAPGERLDSLDKYYR